MLDHSVLPGGTWFSVVSAASPRHRMHLCNVDWEGFPVFSVDIEPTPKGYNWFDVSLISGWKSGGKEVVVFCQQQFSAK